MIRVEVSCPSCKKKGYIEISEDAIKNVSRGILAVNIPEKTICKDNFIAYIDKNLNIRDYFMADFQLELPEAILEEIEKIDEQKKYLIEKVFDLDLIKFNLPAILLAFTSKGIFMGCKIILILDKLEFLHEHIYNFYRYITHDSFKLELSIASKIEYEKNKNNYKDYLVFEGKDIVYDKNKSLNLKRIPIERRIIQKFLAESNQDLSLLTLRNEIQKAFELSKFIFDYLSKIGAKKKIDITEINKGLQEKFQVKVSSIYLNFLFEIVEYYHKIEIPGSLKLVLKTIF